LRALAAKLGVQERVHFLGRRSQPELRSLYSAVDALVLASSREGWANVLLEAMACGAPVVASNVWGTPEVVAAPEAGVLMHELSAAGVAQGVTRLRAAMPDRAQTRRYAEKFDWLSTTQGQLRVFRGVLGLPG
jgi:glycosyltransferase involved in cell wall biosynthesis